MRFRCVRGCTNCCTRKGFVYLSGADVERAAAWLGMTREDFESRYVYRTRHLFRLRKPPGAECPFLDSNGCTIHPVKPTQCRLFPFWPELVENRGEWEALKSFCPGIGTGQLIQIGTAVETADEMKRAYPSLYR